MGKLDSHLFFLSFFFPSLSILTLYLFSSLLCTLYCSLVYDVDDTHYSSYAHTYTYTIERFFLLFFLLLLSPFLSLSLSFSDSPSYCLFSHTYRQTSYSNNKTRFELLSNYPYRLFVLTFFFFFVFLISS